MTQKTLFIIKGSGEKKRSHNITTIRKLILKGLTYEQIWQQAMQYITSKTFYEYYQIAKKLIEEKQYE